MPVRMDHDQSWTFPHQAHNQVDNLTITYFPQHDNDWTSKHGFFQKLFFL